MKVPRDETWGEGLYVDFPMYVASACAGPTTLGLMYTDLPCISARGCFQDFSLHFCKGLFPGLEPMTEVTRQQLYRYAT
jgi:hypothetical protein